MRVVAVLALLGVAAAFSVPDGWRLIRLTEELEFFASPEQIDMLALQNIHFADVTDTYELEGMSPVVHAKNVRFYPGVLEFQDIANQIIPLTTIDGVRNNLQTFQDFHNRRRDSVFGVESSLWLFENAQAVGEPVAQVSHVTNPQFNQNSVIARIEGNGLSNDTVIIGAHQDSTAGGVNDRSPGADDDGSGSIVILEALRVITEAVETGIFSPRRPIEFHWYAGEEGGLVGSSNTALLYASEGRPVYSMVQFDMVGWEAPGGVGIVTDFTDAALNQFVRVLVDEYMNSGWTNRPCGYACSDHASWTRAGYPAAFPFEAPFGSHNPFIHTVNDDITQVSFDHVNEFLRLTIGYLIEASLTLQ